MINIIFPCICYHSTLFLPSSLLPKESASSPQLPTCLSVLLLPSQPYATLQDQHILPWLQSPSH